jgi:hypothetical protein
MDSIRKIALQAELDRIQAEAEANSYAVMNKADQLAAAAMLCARVNEGLAGQGIDFEPTPVYFSGGCNILIYTQDHGREFIQGVHALELSWSIDRAAWEGSSYVRVDCAPGVEIIVGDEFLPASEPAIEAAV